MSNTSTESLVTHILTLFNKQQRHDPDTLLGQELSTFKQLSQNLDGIQPGFYVLGGFPSTGKTTLLVNLLADALQSRIPCLYVSLDDNRDIILNRLVSIKTGLPYNNVKKRLDGEDYDRVKEAWSKLASLSEDGLFHICDISHVSKIEDLKERIPSGENVKPMVFLDGVHNIPSEITTDMRIRNLASANHLKELVDTREIALIGTVELRKRSPLDLKGENGKIRTEPHLDDIMETGKFAYNASVVWLIYPADNSKYSKRPDAYPEAQMILKYAKNKLSGWTGNQDLILDRTCGRLKEATKTELMILNGTVSEANTEQGLTALQTGRKRRAVK